MKTCLVRLACPSRMSCSPGRRSEDGARPTSLTPRASIRRRAAGAPAVGAAVPAAAEHPTLGQGSEMCPRSRPGTATPARPPSRGDAPDAELLPADAPGLPPTAMSINRSALKWESLVTPAQRAAIAGALCALLTGREGSCQEVVRRAAVQRLAAAVDSALARKNEAAPGVCGLGRTPTTPMHGVCGLGRTPTAPMREFRVVRKRGVADEITWRHHPHAGKKKPKKKGKGAAVKLDAEQEALACAAAGCLRHITAVSRAACFLLAELGALVWLVALCEAPSTLLRCSCKVRIIRTSTSCVSKTLLPSCPAPASPLGPPLPSLVFMHATLSRSSLRSLAFASA